MRILVGVSHPKHVHIFRNPINSLIEKGHDVEVIAISKNIVEYLLDKYNVKYCVVGNSKFSIYGKFFSLLGWEYKTLKIVREFKPDLVVGRALPHLAHVSALVRKPFVVFEDTELAKLLHKVTVPFASAVVTPQCYLGDFGKKHIRFNGYFELAYLHPNYFSPERSILDYLGISKKENFIVLRLISWSAYHDVGLRGIDNHVDVIKILEQYGRVFIIPEGKLSRKLEEYKLRVPPEKIHSLLHYARLYIGEGGTMAVEASILGTPSIHIESTSSGVATGYLSGNFLELKNKYGLLYFYPRQDQALKKAVEILEDGTSKKKWLKKRRKLLKEKIDVSIWMVDFIESFVSGSGR